MDETMPLVCAYSMVQRNCDVLCMCVCVRVWCVRVWWGSSEHGNQADWQWRVRERRS